MRWAALLKGVNVGGNRKLPMADLRAFITGLGYGDAKTLLASGNIVFEADAKDGAALEDLLKQKAANQLGLKTDFFLRAAADLHAILNANPFTEAARDHPNHLVVIFHRDRFDPGRIDALDYDGPERLAARGRELLIDYPEDIGHSKLGPAMAKARFPKMATARNWNTVTKLAAMLEDR